MTHSTDSNIHDFEGTTERFYQEDGATVFCLLLTEVRGL